MTVTGSDAITVRNGSITKFGAGLRLFGRHHLVEEVRVGNSSRGIQVGQGIIRNNIPSNNRDFTAIGIEAGLIEVSAATGFLEEGGSTIIGNVADANNIGIQVVCPSVVVNNAANDNDVADMTVAFNCTRLANSPAP